MCASKSFGRYLPVVFVAVSVWGCSRSEGPRQQPQAHQGRNLAEMMAEGLGQAPEGEDPEIAKKFAAKKWRSYKDFHIHTHEPLIVLDIEGPLTPEDCALIAKSKVVTTLSLTNARPTDAGLAELAKLPTLQTLIVMGDQVTGQGVKSLAKAAALKHLHLFMLKDVNDEAVAPLGKLANLETLEINTAKLTGECFATFAGHPKLRLLKLEGLQGFTDAGAAHLAKIPNLENLELRTTTGYGESDKSAFTSAGVQTIAKGHLPARFKCDPKLIDDTLFVEMVQKGWIPPNDEIDIAKRPEDLKVLLLEGYKIGDPGFRAALRFSGATLVGIKEIKVSDAAFSGLKDFHNLNYLRLEKLPVSGAALAAVAGLPLKHLAMEECELSEEHFKAMGQMKQLEELWLDESKFKPEWLKHIGGLPRLKELNLRSTAFNDEAAAVVKELSALENITANKTDLGDKGFALLLQQPKLKQVGVDDTKVTKEAYLAAKKQYDKKSFSFYRYDQEK